MRKQTYPAVVTALLAPLVFPNTVVPVRAQSAAPAQAVQIPEPTAVAPAAGTAGRIAKFVTSTKLGNSVLHENAGMLGLGTVRPRSKLDIRARNALNIWERRPFMTFRDSAAGNARHVIQSVDGGLNLLGENYLNKQNPFAFVGIDRDGRIGFGTADPISLLQIGPSLDAAFTIEPSVGSPHAGSIRFGDSTGWSLVIGRSRPCSGCPLNTGFNGGLLQIRDDGELLLHTYPRGATGTQPLCNIPAGLYGGGIITPCQASSLRYKTDLADYRGGLDVIDRLRPITFTRKASGARDVGLAAEDVAAVEPMFTFPNGKGEIEGIRYELLSVVFVNAIKEQQSQIQRQQKLIDELEARLARLEQATRGRDRN